MSHDNLKLWDLVQKTDPAFTKKASKGAYNFTSVAPMYQNKKATEQFGVQGIGWGIVVGSESFEEKTYGTTTILSYDAVLYFVLDGVRGEIPIHASEKSCYKTNGFKGKEGYMKIDDEVRKKVVTNAKTKGLSELGFSADIFMGMFDDPNYVDYLNYEQSINNAEDKSKEIVKKTNELKSWCKKEIATHDVCKTKHTLDLVIVKQRQTLKNKCQLLNLDFAAWGKSFTESYDKRLKAISGEEK